MTEQQERKMRALINLTVSLITVAILISIAYPGISGELGRARQWLRYYRWKARWSALPPWLREAAVVRGLGPEE